MRIRTFLAEPMLHFLLIGIALFGAYRWKAPGDSGGRRIVITQGVIDDLVTQHVGARGREPSTAELSHLIESVRPRRDPVPGRRETWARARRHRREAPRAAEDRDDRGGGRLDTGTDRRDLSAYLVANQARFVQPAILTFEQVFIGPSASGPGVVHLVALTDEALRKGADPEGLGKPTLLPAPDDADACRSGCRAISAPPLPPPSRR